MPFAVKPNATSTLISSGFVTLSSRVPDPTVDQLVSTNRGAAGVDATKLCLDLCVSTENEVNRCLLHVLRHARVCGPRESFATGQRLEVTGCEDNASACNAEAHTDEHLELAVWDTMFLNSIFRMMPDLNTVGLAKARNTFSSRHLASTKTCPHAKGCTETAPGMPKVAPHNGRHDRNESTRISTFSTSPQKQGIQTAHWKRFKSIRVKHTSDGNIAVSH